MSLQWQEGESSSVTAPLFCVKSQARQLVQRDGQMDQGLRRVEVTGGYAEKGHRQAH